MRSKRVRWRLAAMGPIGALAAALALAACGSAGPPRPTAAVGTDQLRVPGPHAASVGGKFAGFVRTGELTSIAAHWRVPAVHGGSQPGRAATWIGAQSLAFKGGDQPFIQIGTREELRAARTRGGPGVLFYETFWTDPEHGLHPISLFPVRANDAISAQMSLHHHQVWWLTITDTTSGRHRLVTTRDEGGDDFQLALWLQEDPTATATNRATAYPDLAAVRMSALTVNGASPAAASLESTWMNLPHAYLAPTAPSGDAFSVVPRQLSAAGLRYLQLTDALDHAVNAFLAQAGRWRRQTPSRTELTATTDRFISALTENVTGLRGRSWPPAVATAVRRLAAIYAGQVPALRHAETVGPEAVLAALPQGGGAVAHVTLAEQIRAGLGLPGTAY
jgi:hypothetical protein